MIIFNPFVSYIWLFLMYYKNFEDKAIYIIQNINLQSSSSISIFLIKVYTPLIIFKI